MGRCHDWLVRGTNEDHLYAGYGWVTDGTHAMVIDAGVDYALNLPLKGTTISASVKKAGVAGWQGMAGHVFNAVTVDGAFGLLSRSGSSSFDKVALKTDDPAFGTQTLLASTAPEATVAGDGTALTIENLDAIVDAAIDRMSNAYALDAGQWALLESVNIEIFDVGGLRLGETNGTTIRIDTDAAGYGWFIDSTPIDDAEFSHQIGGEAALVAGSESAAFGDMDLLTVVMHEFGPVLGFAGSELWGGCGRRDV